MGININKPPNKPRPSQSPQGTTSSKGKRLIRFQDWFDPYNLQHIEWARQYLTDPSFDWEKVCPKGNDFEICPLGNCYGIREHVLMTFATCWILATLEGQIKPDVTH